MPDPKHDPANLNEFVRLMFDLQRWRDEDQQDHITLSRHQIIVLIEGVNRLK